MGAYYLCYTKVGGRGPLRLLLCNRPSFWDRTTLAGIIPLCIDRVPAAWLVTHSHTNSERNDGQIKSD